MVGLDRERREVLVAPFIDDEGQLVTPERSFGYDGRLLTREVVGSGEGLPPQL